MGGGVRVQFFDFLGRGVGFRALHKFGREINIE